MNKKARRNIRCKMIMTALLFSYGLSTSLFLIVLYAKGEHWNKLYQQALMDSYSLERIRVFFQKLQPLFRLLYPLVDRLNKPHGRPATDRRFQLRFLFFWKFFCPGSPSNAVNRLNKSPELQQILEAPIKPYTRYSLRRFLQAVGEEGFIKMGLLVIAEMIRRRIVDFTKVLLDSFPIYSFLNTAKCLSLTGQWLNCFFTTSH